MRTPTQLHTPDSQQGVASISGTQYFVMGSVLLGTIGIFVHEAAADPLTTTWFRCAFGLAGLTLWVLARKQLHRLRLPRHIWLHVAAIGVLMVISWGLFFAAIERTSAGLATVLFHIQPLWVLLLGGWWLKESIEKRHVALVLLAMVGLVMATGITDQILPQTGTTRSEAAAERWIGAGLCVIGAFCIACVTLLSRQVKEVKGDVIAWWQCAIGTVLLLAWPLTMGWPEWGSSWLWLSGLGLIHTGLAYSLMFTGIAQLDISRIAGYQLIYPAIVIFIDWLFYGHALDNWQLAGIALMGGAIWLTGRTPARSISVVERV